MAKTSEQNPHIIIYETETGKRIKMRLQDDTIWLSQKLMAELFQTTKQNISNHIIVILSKAKLDENSVKRVFLPAPGERKNYNTKFYNLDVIIEVSYHVRSRSCILFRQWVEDWMSIWNDDMQ